MRNWNSSNAELSGQNKICFESTYEELKLPGKPRLKDEAPCVLSLPMRNWNIFNTYLDKYVSVSFESTYEELKLILDEI